jgi:hypothetical protein
MLHAEAPMSPLNRVRVSSLAGATILAGGIVYWMTVHFNVPWSRYHWWLFGVLWFFFFAAFVQGGIQHEALRFMGRNNKSDDVFRHIERNDN